MTMTSNNDKGPRKELGKEGRKMTKGRKEDSQGKQGWNMTEGRKKDHQGKEGRKITKGRNEGR